MLTIVDSDNRRAVRALLTPGRTRDAATEKRPDISRDEARICERVSDSGVFGLPP